MSNAILDSSKLYKISKQDWSKLQELYKRNWPKHILTYYTLKTHIEWIGKNPKLNMKMYTTDENWQQNGTFLLVEINGPRCNVIFNTLNASKNGHLVVSALKCLHRNSDFSLTAFAEQMRPVVMEFLKELGLKELQDWESDTILYYLPKTEALQFEGTPAFPGFTFKSLSLDDVAFIDNLWPHRYPGSDEFIRNVVCFNLTLGAYDESSGGKLCGWVMQEQIGTIALLQVVESHKRKGLGEQLVRRMVVLMAKIGMDSTATILCNNRASRHLFHKLGFKIIDRAIWYDHTIPKLNEDEIGEATILKLLDEVDCV